MFLHFPSPHPLPSLPQLSFDLSEYTANVDGVGTLRLLDAIRTCGLGRTVKFYQVGKGELNVCGLHFSPRHPSSLRGGGTEALPFGNGGQ